MAIAYRSSATAGDSSGGNLTINKPTGTADGDIMIMALYREAGTWTLPAGWTQVVETRDTGSDAIYLTVAWKRASSEGSSYSVTLSTTTWRMGSISSFSGGLASGDPIDTYATDATALDVARLASITTSVADTMLVGVFGDYNGSGVSAGTSGMTGVVGPATVSVLYVAKASAGSTGTVTGFSGGLNSSGWASVHLAIKPATGSGYTLTAAQGSLTLTGQAAALLAARLLAAAQGSYTLSGQAVALLIARLIAAGQGGYTLTGRAVALTYSGDTFTTPANRIYIIEAEARTLTVAAEIRSHLVDGETRIYSVRGE